LLYLSDYIEAHRQDYYDLLQRVRTHGDWNGWLQFFTAGVAETAADATRQVTRLIELREKHRDATRGSPRTQQLLDALFTNPYMSVARAQKFLGVSHPTASNAITLLERAGILKEVTGRRWGRLFVATDVLAAVDRRAERPGEGG
jgi:Fic family protein